MKPLSQPCPQIKVLTLILTEIFLSYDVGKYLVSPVDGVNALKWPAYQIVIQKVQDPQYVKPWHTNERSLLHLVS